MADSPDPNSIILYWRPGCGFCRTLAAGLQGAGIPFEPVNIWEHPEAAAFVRSVAAGNEVVPTIRIGATALVNPSAREVLHAAVAEVPSLFSDLLPD